MTREEAIFILRGKRDISGEKTAGALDMAIKALEQKPCEDAISRQAVLNLIEHYNSDGLGSVFYGYDEGVKFANAVNKLPSVRPQTKIGHWIKGNYHIRCSECNEEVNNG